MILRTTFISTLCLLLYGVTASAQLWRISSRSEEITSTTYVAGSELLQSRGYTAYRYNSGTRSWDSIQPMQILAANRSYVLLRDAQQSFHFSDDSGRTTRSVDVPFLIEENSQICMSGDSVAILTGRRLYITTDGGHSGWRELKTFFPSAEVFKDRIFWYDSLIVVATAYPYVSHSFLSLKDRRNVSPFDDLILDADRARDLVAFSYQGRLSLTRRHADTSDMFLAGESDISAAQIADAVIIFAPFGRHYITRDSGVTWTTEQFLPSFVSSAFRSFEHGDSLYIYLGPRAGWWSSDISLREWTRVTYDRMPGQSAYAHRNDSLLVWTNDVGLLRFSGIELTARPVLVNRGKNIPISAYTTESGIITSVFASEVHRSSDGGRTWSTRPTPERITSCGYSGRRCWMAGNLLYISHDEGETWDTLDLPATAPKQRSVTYHNGSALFRTDDGAFMVTPNSDVIPTVLPTVAVPSSYAVFDGTAYIATNVGLFRYREGRWFAFPDDAGAILHTSLRPNDDYYYGTDTARRPIRWRPGTLPEVLDSVQRIANPTLAFTGPFVVYTSKDSGTFVYLSNKPTSVAQQQEIPYVNRVIVHARNLIDLRDYSHTYAKQPNVTIYSISGRVVHSQYDSWLVRTENIPQGLYMLVVSDGKTHFSMMVYISSD